MQRSHTILFCALQVILAMVVLQTSYINNDVAWHLYVGEQLLRGKILYEDIIEVNLPLVYYLRSLMVKIAYFTSLNPTWIANTLMLLFSMIALGGCAVLQLRQNAGLLVIICFALVILPICLVINQFGQKEHVFMVLALPYLLLPLASHYPSRGIRIIIGTLAGIGFCLKPFFFIPFIVMALYNFWQQKSMKIWFQAETVMVVMLSLSYVLFLVTVTPEYFYEISYFGKFYYYYRMPLDGYTILSICLLLWFYFLPAGASFTLASRSKEINYLLLLLIGMVVAGAIQLKFWDYHFYPTMVIAILIGFYVSIEVLPIWWKEYKVKHVIYIHKIQALLVGITIMCVLYVTVTGLLQSYVNDRANRSFLLDKTMMMTNILEDKKSIVVLSEKMIHAFPLVNYSRLHWGMRFGFLWLLTGIENFKTAHADKSPEWLAKETNGAELYLLDSVAKDIAGNRPDIVLVDVNQSLSMRWSGEAIDYIAYFSRSPLFKEVWKDYKFHTYIDDEKENPKFAVYVRE